MKRISSILIVDDDIDDREIFSEAVAKVDPSIKCFTAIDGEDALKKLNDGGQQLPEIIFLDLNMPRMDGRLLLTELRKNPVFDRVPVVIYSTSSMQRDVDETIKLGATRFFAKPSDFKELCNALSGILLAETK